MLPTRANRWRRVALVIALVSLGHWVVLFAAPLHSGVQHTGASPMVFETRWIAPQQPTPQATVAPNVPQQPHSSTRRSATVSHLPLRSPSPAINAVPDMAEETQVQVAAARVEEPPPSPKLVPATASLSTRIGSLPQSVRLLYDIKGETKRIPISAQGELLWRQDGKTYDARLEIKIFLLGSRIQTSKGLIGPQGLEPIRFGDKVRSEVAAHFERGKGKVSYSANTPDEPLQAGAQDQLSIFFQLAGMLASDPERYPPGSSLGFQAVGPRSSETWVFKVAPSEQITLPGGQVRTLRLSKDPVSEYDSRAEVWLAPELEYLPVRIRLTQANGDMVDQLWRATERLPATP